MIAIGVRNFHVLIDFGSRVHSRVKQLKETCFQLEGDLLSAERNLLSTRGNLLSTKGTQLVAERLLFSAEENGVRPGSLDAQGADGIA